MKTITKMLLGVCLLFLLVGIVSAEENTTDIVSDTSTTSTASKIIVEDYVAEYGSNAPLNISVADKNGKLIKNKEIKIEKWVYVPDYEWELRPVGYVYTGETGIATITPKMNVGQTVWELTSDKVTKSINVEITEAPTKITTYKISQSNTHKVTLKAKVTDKYNKPITEGEVVFDIANNVYIVKVKNGFATKTVTLSKAGTYNYKASFQCDSCNYKEVSSKNKVILKYPTKTVTVKAGKHKKVFGERIDCNIKDQDGSIRKKPSVMITCNGIDMPKHTKLLKAKMYFKNKRTGKIITKTSSKVKWSAITFKLPANYKVYKVKVWYRYK